MEATILRCMVCGASSPADEKNEPRICEKHWRCPECGTGPQYVDEFGQTRTGFIIEDADYVVCNVCKSTWTYRGVERAICAKHNRVTCPHCKGSGMVQGPAKKKPKK